MWDFQEFAGLMKQLALDAGAAVMEVYKRSYSTEIKADGSPVTSADRLAEGIILAGLKRAYPHAGYLSEETADSKGRL